MPSPLTRKSSGKSAKAKKKDADSRSSTPLRAKKGAADKADKEKKKEKHVAAADAKLAKQTQKFILDKAFGILTWDKYQHKKIDELDFDVFDIRFSVEALFGSLKGGALLDEMFAWFGDGEEDIPWYTIEEEGASPARPNKKLKQHNSGPSSAASSRSHRSSCSSEKDKHDDDEAELKRKAELVKTRNIVRSPFSRDIQNDTMQTYKGRILNEGLSQLAGGEAVFKWTNKLKTFPIHAGTANHRCEAFYTADKENPDNPNIIAVKERGWKRCKCM
jgi:hypothetical protein